MVDTESGFAVLLWYNYHGARPSNMARGIDVELQHLVDLIRDDLPFERPGPVGLSPYGQSVWRSDDGVLRSTDDAKGSTPQRRMRLEIVTYLLVQVWGHTLPNPPPLAHKPRTLILDIRSKLFPCPLPVSVETLDVPRSPRAHMRHTAKSTISHLLDPLIGSSLKFRHTTPLSYGSPLDLRSCCVRTPPQPTL